MKRKISIKTLLLDIIILITVFLILKFVVGLGYASSGSMEPTIMTGDITIDNKVSYLFGCPQRGDIVVFTLGSDKTNYAKRIVGLPGEKIRFKNGRIYINDECLDESIYGNKNRYTFCEKEFMIPENHYFVLGDNRMDSYDSRYWDNPYISKNDISGRIIFTFHI